MTMRQKRRRGGGRVRNRRNARRRLRRRMERIMILSMMLLVLIIMVSGALYLLKYQLEPEPEEDSEPVLADMSEPEEEEDNSIIIIVDAGHGGTDQGTCYKDVLEKDINIAVAKKLARRLERDDVKVIMTREEDEKVKLGERVKLANDQEAALFISIHCNYCEEDRSVKGLECYYQEGDTDGKKLAENISQAFQNEDSVVNRGTRTGDLKVLRETEMPAALVEIGFLSNWGECQQLLDEEYQNLLARKIADGVFEELSL